MTSPALGGRNAYYINSRCATDLKYLRVRVLWRGTDSQLHTFHAATCGNAYEQYVSWDDVSDVKMT